MEKKFDRSMFLSKFQEETREHLRVLNQDLLIMENDSGNPKILEELEREVHTLKGSAKMMGYKEIAEITHRMEDIFGLLRQKSIELKKEMIDVLFESLDGVDILLKAIVKGEKHNVKVKDLCERLEKINRGEEITSSDFKKKDRMKDKKIKKKTTEKKKRKKDEEKDEEQEEEQEEEKEEEKDEEKVKKTAFSDRKIMETIRVDTEKMDKLVNLIGEVVVMQIKSERCLSRIKELKKSTEKQVFLWNKIYNTRFREGNFDSREAELIFNEVNNKNVQIKDESAAVFNEYNENSRQMSLIIESLQQKVMAVRMLPLSTVFNFFPRAVRDLAREYGKEIELEIKGEDIELDKKILEEIKDPLIHLVRNAVDHGIEETKERRQLNKPIVGKVKLFARQEGGRVYIFLEDDGRGIDIKKLKEIALKKEIIGKNTFEKISDREAMYLVFEQGLSTSPIITDVSGRGIGMDVVKSKIEGLKGMVLVESEKGKGTNFSLSLPLTLVTTRVLLVELEGQNIFAIPIAFIETVNKVYKEDIVYVEGKEAFRLGRRVIPLINLSDLLDLPVQSRRIDGFFVVVISHARQRIGIVVDKLMEEEEIVIKNLGSFLKKIRNIIGTTLLESGKVVLVLNVSEIIHLAGMINKVKVFRSREEKKKIPSILIVEDSLTTRELERNIIESAGYQVEVAIDGVEATEKLNDTKFDLLIADVQMPRMNGFQLTEWIKKSDKHKDMPVIIVTSLEKEGEKKKGIKAGAQAYIVKSSFDQSTLLDTIERLIE
ncbi:hybrid sensor histidine kinase/response regulator [bacterium]|nr:hybrid sensor histidine kinase/response regulator [bacterium]